MSQKIFFQTLDTLFLPKRNVTFVLLIYCNDEFYIFDLIVALWTRGFRLVTLEGHVIRKYSTFFCH